MTRAEGYGEVDVAEGVQSALAALQVQYPYVEVEEAFNFVGPVLENYQGSLHILFEGMALAVLVVFCFLRNWRATLIAAVTLPAAVDHPYLRFHAPDGLHAQCGDAAGALAGDRGVGR